MPKASKFYFPSTDREERFGALKFGAEWEGPQMDRELELLARFFDPGPKWVAFGDEGPHAASPLESWVYPSGSGNGSEAHAARNRALKRRRQLAEVQERLRLVDKYGHQPSGSEDFERLDPGDDRGTLQEARSIIGNNSQAVGANAPVLELVSASTPEAVPNTHKHDGSRASSKAESECKKWLIDYAVKYPEKHPLGKKDQVAEVAMKKFKGLSKRGFDRVWGQVVTDYPVRWHMRKRSGPRKGPAEAKKPLTENHRTN